MKYLTVKIDEKEIEYFVNGTGKNIIFIHGLGGSLKTWEKTIYKLSKKFKCWSISLPWYEDFKIRRYSELIEAFIKKLKIENPYIVGHSLGGLISIDIANRNEIEKMVLISTPLARITPKGLKTLVESLDDKINENILFNKSSKWFFSRIPNVREIIGKSSIESFSNYSRGVVDLDFPFDASKLKLDERFILVYGKNDFLLKLLHGTELYEKIGAEKIIILDSDHSIPTKKPKKLSEIIENFFTEEPNDFLEVMVGSILQSIESLFDFIESFLKSK